MKPHWINTAAINSVAIVGAGPSGCALACFLQQRGINVSVYDIDKTPGLMVGESLVPAVIPILRRLGIEQEVAEISHIKRGAALRHGNGNRVDFAFQQFGKDYPDYSYNVPRPGFDHIVKQRAKALGVNFVQHKAKIDVEHDGGTSRLRLSAESLLAAGLNRSTEPDLLVDATGRTRLFSKLLNIPASRGPRNDVSHFAHFTHFESDSSAQGQVVLSALECGWSWQIPLRNDVTSVGVVLNKDAAKLYGSSAEARLDAVIEHNEVLRVSGQRRQRISEVMTYTNYQLMADRAHGEGWVLLGDALGFVDPMLSPGVFMALESAVLLDKALFASPIDSSKAVDQSCANYYSQMRDWHAAWQRLITYFYDGRLLAMGQMRDHIRQQSRFWSISRYAEPLVSRVLSQLVSGVGTRSEFNQAVLHHTTEHLIQDKTCLQRNQIASALSQTAANQLQNLATKLPEDNDQNQRLFG